MADTPVDLNIIQGATFRKTLLWRQPPTPDQEAAHLPGDPYDLDGCRATMQIRTKVNGDILLTLYDQDGLILMPDDPTSGDPQEGVIVIELDSQRTMSLEITKPGSYDLFVIFPSGDVLRVVKGSVNVDLSVTDPVDA